MLRTRRHFVQQKQSRDETVKGGACASFTNISLMLSNSKWRPPRKTAVGQIKQKTTRWEIIFLELFEISGNHFLELFGISRNHSLELLGISGNHP